MTWCARAPSGATCAFVFRGPLHSAAPPAGARPTAQAHAGALPQADSFLERQAGITGTRKRLDDALDDAMPPLLTPKRVRGTEDLLSKLHI